MVTVLPRKPDMAGKAIMSCAEFEPGRRGGPQKRLDTAYRHSRITNVYSRSNMAEPKLSKLELRIMDALWTRGEASIREIQESFPARNRPAYTTIQDRKSTRLNSS